MKDRKEPVLAFAVVQDLEAYMAGEPADSKGCWLKVSKAGAPEATVSKAEAIEAALRHGWIDGQLDSFDAHYFLTRMTPRRRGSRWSRKNRDTAERLLREGRVKPAGLAEIEAAKADGRWEAAYESQSKAEPAPDLAAALAANEGASRVFDTLDSANRYAVIWRVNDAKRPDTRAKRIAQYVEMLARGETLHPPRKKR